MRSLGQGVVEFKKGMQDIEDDSRRPANKIEDQSSRPQVAAATKDGTKSQTESA
jgi:Sec-independent protein translocase protein TatA